MTQMNLSVKHRFTDMENLLAVGKGGGWVVIGRDELGVWD